MPEFEASLFDQVLGQFIMLLVLMIYTEINRRRILALKERVRVLECVEEQHPNFEGRVYE